MARVQFTKHDVATIDRLERLLQRFSTAIDDASQVPAFPSLDSLALRLAPLLRDQLQATGVAPLNLQSLLPASASAGIPLQDTHANRLTLYPPSNYPVGTLFLETDRQAVYVVYNSSGTIVWKYVAGMYAAAFASRPTDLSTNDVGFLYFVLVYRHTCRWSGSAWVILDNDAGSFRDSAFALGDGFALCDGSATTILEISGATLVETAFTTPDEVTAPSGVYHKSIAAYTGTINAASAGAISGSTANTTATNQAAATGVTVDPHSVSETGETGTTEWVFDSEADADHTVNDPQHNHIQDQHLHAAGTLAVAATGEPRNLGVLRYVRR